MNFRLTPLVIAMAAFATPVTAQLAVEGRIPPLDGAVSWINSPALSTGDLRGKVVLIDFWTYTCINWRRTVPWLRTWAEWYRDAGLVVVGVHTPEFGFEAKIENVARAAREQAIGYPVAVDSRYGIWRAFGNQYWPALYFVDAQGRIRHHQFGEGDYDALESVVRQLLVEAGADDLPSHSPRTVGRGAEARADWVNLRSPETYLGAARADGNHVAHQIPDRLRLNRWALAGRWEIESEYAELVTGTGRVAFQFHARDVHLVMGPSPQGRPARFRVWLDGQPLGDARGVDVDADGHGVADQPRMYHLVRQPGSITNRRLEIEFLDPGVQLFVFTFG